MSSHQDAITRVVQSMTVPRSDPKKIQAADLLGGVAVLVDFNAAYWVKDGVVRAANGWAKTWSPALKYTGNDIHIKTVEAAIEKEDKRHG